MESRVAKLTDFLDLCFVGGGPGGGWIFSVATSVSLEGGGAFVWGDGVDVWEGGDGGDALEGREDGGNVRDGREDSGDAADLGDGGESSWGSNHLGASIGTSCGTAFCTDGTEGGSNSNVGMLPFLVLGSGTRDGALVRPSDATGGKCMGDRKGISKGLDPSLRSVDKSRGLGGGRTSNGREPPEPLRSKSGEGSISKGRRGPPRGRRLAGYARRPAPLTPGAPASPARSPARSPAAAARPKRPARPR
jgi:hypothetical protein